MMKYLEIRSEVPGASPCINYYFPSLNIISVKQSFFFLSFVFVH